MFIYSLCSYIFAYSDQAIIHRFPVHYTKQYQVLFSTHSSTTYQGQICPISSIIYGTDFSKCSTLPMPCVRPL
ncbi:hypothetical protein SS1G_11410 [Sclerotinia sclerotiorum 1980 UF-70]|uniref:Uncharacterized protein n=1 Tax=Sclerotinia sclerotiorum (strain ATCC 18683 / 1980 / Ss-1) TaxID=665079 RepID=A7F1E0_SCLS1|nr:hypothetical protein SS1G_11410 [Sclerotinia sclerotiorum 1980 UF-70]EDN95532.1 hypothetical protein SS1G_11410 [Sclerotinia sclerotiorum 1980 UF-70]